MGKYDTKLVKDGNPKGKSPEHRAVIIDLMVVIGAQGKSRYNLPGVPTQHGMGLKKIEVGKVSDSYLTFSIPVGDHSRQTYLFYPPSSTTVQNCAAAIEKLEHVDWRAKAKRMREEEEKAEREAKEAERKAKSEKAPPAGPIQPTLGSEMANAGTNPVPPNGPVRFMPFMGATEKLPTRAMDALGKIFPEKYGGRVFSLRVPRVTSSDKFVGDGYEVGNEVKDKILTVKVFVRDGRTVNCYECELCVPTEKLDGPTFVSDLKAGAAARRAPRIKPVVSDDSASARSWANPATVKQLIIEKMAKVPPVSPAPTAPEKEKKEVKRRRDRDESGWRGITYDREKQILVLRAIHKVVGQEIFWTTDENRRRLEPLLPEGMQGADPRAHGKSFSGLVKLGSPLLLHHVKQGRVPSEKINGYSLTGAGIKLVGDVKAEPKLPNTKVKKARAVKPAKAAPRAEKGDDISALSTAAAPAIKAAKALQAIDEKIASLDAERKKLIAQRERILDGVTAEARKAAQKLQQLMGSLTGVFGKKSAK